MKLLKQAWDYELFRFLLIGGFNTAIAYVIYLAGMLIFNYAAAYSIAYFLSVLSAYYFNTLFVFRESFSLKKFLKFPFVYFVQYFLGLLLMYILIERLACPAWIAPLIVVVLTIPLTFLLARGVLRA